MLMRHTLSTAGSLCAFLFCVIVPAQTAQPGLSQAESVFSRVNKQVTLSRAGSSAATTELARQLFRNVAISTEMADALGYTSRIAQADTEYRTGGRPAIHEADVVKAVNNFVNTIGAPQWTHTNLAEVRKLRMHMVTLYPQLLASHEPPDAKGHYKAVSEGMSPMEVSYLATSLLFQKAFNAEYQFSNEERTENMKLGPVATETKHRERVQAIQDLLHGKTQSMSVRDLLTASDHFFSDLGIESAANLSIVKFATTNQIAMAKGGR